MRWAGETDGPFVIHLADGVTLDALSEDGGGQCIGATETGDEPFYETHWTAPDGSFLTVPQEQIAKVLVAGTGEEVEFGNPFIGPHPRPRDLGDVDD